MSKRTVLGVLIRNRASHAREFQDILSQHGCHIRTRLGLHEVGVDVCSPNGLVLLEIPGEKAAQELEIKLGALQGFEVQKMQFEG